MEQKLATVSNFSLMYVAIQVFIFEALFFIRTMCYSFSCFHDIKLWKLDTLAKASDNVILQNRSKKLLSTYLDEQNNDWLYQLSGKYVSLPLFLISISFVIYKNNVSN